MRKLLLLVFLVINVFLYILNMELFNSVVDIDFGFAVVSFMPLILLQLIGLLFVLAFFFLDMNRESKKINAIQKLTDKNTILEKDIEITNLKLENQTSIPTIEAVIDNSPEEIA